MPRVGGTNSKIARPLMSTNASSRNPSSNPTSHLNGSPSISSSSSRLKLGPNSANNSMKNNSTGNRTGIKAHPGWQRTQGSSSSSSRTTSQRSKPLSDVDLRHRIPKTNAGSDNEIQGSSHNRQDGGGGGGDGHSPRGANEVSDAVLRER